jgi:hypothetical protein
MQGLGLRLRNPSLIWDFIELRAAMQYLNSGAPQTNFSLNLKPARLLGAFSGKRPQPFRY